MVSKPILFIADVFSVVALLRQLLMSASQCRHKDYRRTILETKVFFTMGYGKSMIFDERCSHFLYGIHVGLVDTTTSGWEYETQYAVAIASNQMAY